MAVGIQGFNPVNLIGGQVYAGAVRQLPIASGYAQNIGFGDLVGISGGYIIRVDNGGSAVTGSTFPAVKPVGIFLGCSFTDPNLKYFVNKQFWPTGTVASDAMALVCEDPEAVFKITLTNSSGATYTSGAATVAAVGKNIGYYQPATPMSTSTGNSLVSANLSSAATTATLPFRIVDLVKDTALPDGTFVEALVTYQLGVHFYRQTTGA